MGRTRTSSCSSSSSASSLPHPSLRLGLSIYTSTPTEETTNWGRRSVYVEGNDSNNNPALFVKVYIDGIPIGRKLNLLVHDGYHSLISTLEHMFGATILWADVEIVNSARFHVLTYEDQEGDWLIVGDVPWEMFLTSMKRLKITRADRF